MSDVVPSPDGATPDPASSGLIVDPAALDISSVAGPRPVADAPARRWRIAGPSTRPEHGDLPRRSLRKRRWVRVCAAIAALLVGYYGINLFQVWQVGRSDQARPVDAIIVMGAAQYDGRPSPVLQARLDHVVELWDLGLAPLVVVTGGNQPGDRFTEAAASAAYLAEHGVDPAAIEEEDAGHSSWESLSGVAEILRAHGVERVLLVSDPYHSLRIRLMAEDLGFTAYVSPTRTSPLRGSAAFGREVKEAAGIALGRVIGFDSLLSITG